uniref:BZIP domain-containing protein n=1 Tax=Kalanchoe fedtschenkoi TaxID=63787 RepID=A0A7N1A1I8_KALFE
MENASDPLRLASALPGPSKEEVSEDDDDVFTVPEMEDASQKKPNDVGGGQEKRGKSRSTADREHKKIKRISAQQARERKKVYVSDMEQRARELQESNARLEEKISTLINENTMLRKVLISSRPKKENAD